MKKMIFTAVAAMSAMAFADVPEVASAAMTQSASSRLVTITYTLDNAPAVVTLDVQTNITGTTEWVSIGGKAVCNAQGDVWKKVGTSGTFNGTITWRPDLSWPDHKIAAGGARAVVTAWALDNTPDYMVVDVSAVATTNSQKYYPAVDYLPGGILSNQNYRTSMLVMRKIMAKDVTWTMGSTSLERDRTIEPVDREKTHQVTLTNNYYIGVFEITQAQWALIHFNRPRPSCFSNAVDRAMRPVENICYNEIRHSSSNVEDKDYYWPANPNPGSFLGSLYTKTGILFDLPSEAQWEFAARAGNGDTKWGDGSGIQNTDTDSNLDMLGRYKMNGGFIDGTTEPLSTCGATNGTAIVGSYAPNDWGLYDMHGNVGEWCLDWWELDISAHGGKVNIDTSALDKNLSGVATALRPIRGGNWKAAAGGCRSANRACNLTGVCYVNVGLRVVCTAGLK